MSVKSKAKAKLAAIITKTLKDETPFGKKIIEKITLIISRVKIVTTKVIGLTKSTIFFRISSIIKTSKQRKNVIKRLLSKRARSNKKPVVKAKIKANSKS